MQIFQRVLNYKFELLSFWQSFSMFYPEMWHHLLDSPVVTTYDQLTNFLFLCIWKRIVRKLRIVFSDPKESKFQLILRSVYKLMNMLIKLQTSNNKLQIPTYCDTWITSLMLINCKCQMLIFVFHSQSICCFLLFLWKHRYVYETFLVQYFLYVSSIVLTSIVI
jgi:hypothetical protein